MYDAVTLISTRSGSYGSYCEPNRFATLDSRVQSRFLISGYLHLTVSLQLVDTECRRRFSATELFIANVQMRRAVFTRARHNESGLSEGVKEAD